MNSKKISTLALGWWLGIGLSAYGQPASAPSQGPVADGTHYPMPMLPPDVAPNPALEQSIARALQGSGQLSRYQLRVIAHGGVVDLVGEVADESQRQIVIRIARMAPGIVMVRDWMQVRWEPAVVQTQAPLPLPQPVLQPLPLPMPQPFDRDPRPGFPPRVDGLLPEPMPIFQPMPGPNPTMQPPPMPPYAWPTTAPYNNYSRVAYPQTYPYEQWPFIGPMYPFPRVPLGWRSVSLTWEDGHWWYHRNPTGHDWWRIRYH